MEKETQNIEFNFEICSFYTSSSFPSFRPIPKTDKKNATTGH